MHFALINLFGCNSILNYNEDRKAQLTRSKNARNVEEFKKPSSSFYMRDKRLTRCALERKKKLRLSRILQACRLITISSTERKRCTVSK